VTATTSDGDDSHLSRQRHSRIRSSWRVWNLLLARSTSLMKVGPTPAFVVARVSGADGVCVATFVRKQQPGAHVARMSSSLLPRDSRPSELWRRSGRRESRRSRACRAK
jgi:hypothetical protein